MNVSILLACVAYVCMLLGIAYARRTKIHLRWMSLAAMIDVSLVLGLQFSRDAIGTLGTGDLNFYQWIHVSSSSLAVSLYIPNILLGFLSRPPMRFHRRLGKIIFALRSLGFIFMWFM